MSHIFLRLYTFLSPSIFTILFIKGLVARCHSFLFIFTLIEQTYNIYIYYSESTTLVIFIASARWRASSGVPSRDSNSGLPYSKPTRYYLSHIIYDLSLIQAVFNSVLYVYLHFD
jgi:hypothetical protein